MKRLALIALVLLAVAGCMAKKSVITKINCETDAEGNRVCETANAGTTSKFCTYLVDRASGNDCDSLDIDTGTTICVLCDPTQSQCPAKVSFSVDGADCTMKVHRLSGNCTTCPQDGVTVKVVED
jgi:hypothetical protein